MGDLIQIKPEYRKRKMKESGDVFEAKKISSAFYVIKDSITGLEYRHLATVVEELSEEVK